MCSIQDDMLKGTTNLKIVKALHHINPEAVIIANSLSLEESLQLYEVGAHYVYLARIEAATAITKAVEQALDNKIHEHRANQEASQGKWHERDEVFS